MDKKIDFLNRLIESAIYTLIFSIPFSKSMIEICVTVAFVAWVAKKFIAKDFRLKKTPFDVIIICFVAFNLLSVINSPEKVLFMRYMVTKCLKYVVLFYIIAESIDSERKFKNCLKLALISAVIIMIDGYLQYYVFHEDVFLSKRPFKYEPEIRPDFLGFPTATFDFPNDLSAWMLVILFPALWFLMWWKRSLKVRLLLMIFLPPFFYLFYLANTRSAWFAFLSSAAIMFMAHSRKIFIIFIVLIACVLILSALFLSEQRKDDIIGISTSLRDRHTMWSTAYRIFREHPFLGNGLNSFFKKYMAFRDDDHKNKYGSYAHNGYLQMAADIGIFGVTSFIVFIFSLLFRCYMFAKRTKHEFLKIANYGLAGGLMAFLIHSFFDTNLHSLPLVIMFWTWAGITYSAHCLEGNIG